MKKFFALITFALILTGFAAASVTYSNPAVGIWKYSVPSAPEGLDKGDVIIKEADGVLAGKVVFQDGNSVDLKNVKYENDEITFGLYVESEYVSVKAKINGKKMEGQVNSPEGPMSFTAELSEKK